MPNEQEEPSVRVPPDADIPPPAPAASSSSSTDQPPDNPPQGPSSGPSGPDEDDNNDAPPDGQDDLEDLFGVGSEIQRPSFYQTDSDENQKEFPDLEDETEPMELSAPPLTLQDAPKQKQEPGRR